MEVTKSCQLINLNDQNINLILEISIPIGFAIVCILIIIAFIFYYRRKKQTKKKEELKILLLEPEIPESSIISDITLTISMNTAINSIQRFIEKEKSRLENIVFEILDNEEPFHKQTQLKLIEKIGNSSFGIIWKVNDYIDHLYSFKIFIHKNDSDVMEEKDLILFKQMMQEKLQMRDLKNENIIHIIGIGYCLKPKRMVLGIVEPLMQYDLNSFLKIYNRNFPLLRRIEIALKISQGLNYMHYRKYSHNDIKPQNILINWENDNEKIEVKISDFGNMQKENEILNQDRCITIEYSSPEKILRYLVKTPLSKEKLIKSDRYLVFGMCFCKIIF